MAQELLLNDAEAEIEIETEIEAEAPKPLTKAEQAKVDKALKAATAKQAAADKKAEAAKEAKKLKKDPITTQHNDEKVVLVDTELSKKRILNAERIIVEATKDLNEAEKEAFFTAKFKGLGINYEKFSEAMTKLEASPTGLEPSQFIKELGWLPLAQELSRVDLTYPLANLIPIEIVPMGKKLVFYSDYLDADDLAAYKLPADYVKSLYDAGGTLNYEEAWKVYKDIHKGLKIPSIALNDFTSYTSIYLALLGDYSFHIARPIAKELYKMRLQMIQNPGKAADNFDWTTIVPDKTINAISGDDIILQLKDYFDELSVPSRTNQPDAWKPDGALVPLEINLNMQDYVLIAPHYWKNNLAVMVKAGTFHEKYLDLMPEIMPMPYTETFGEYGKAKNVSTNYTKLKMFLVPKAKHKIIQMYQGVRAQPLLTFHDVMHAYTRVGESYDRNYPILCIEVNKTAPAAE